MELLLTSKKFIDMIQEFLNLQEAIMIAFQSEHSEVKDWSYMIGCPKNGVLLASGKKWNFRKHGTGVRFEDCQSFTVIDIVKWKADMLRVFDTTRIVEYFISQHFSNATFRDKKYDLSSERDVNKMIEILTSDQLIFLISTYPYLYSLDRLESVN